MAVGWHQLVPPADAFRGAGNYRIDAYSEFQPPPRVGWKPYGGRGPDPELFSPDDPYGWRVGEFEEAAELGPGLLQVGRQVLGRLSHLRGGHPGPGLTKEDLADNPFWPAELATATEPPHEKCVTLLPLALSRTQDDKGRVRWTLFGNSEQGPGKAFWKGFYTAPKKELPAAEAVRFFCQLLHAVYGETAADAGGLRRAGFRILPDDKPLFDFWAEHLPSWAGDFRPPDKLGKAVKYLLTFRPFGALPAAVRRAYLAGDLHLLPTPGSLVYWGTPGRRRLHAELPLALQIPLQLGIARHRMPQGVRVPQSGFLHEPTADRPHPPDDAGHVRNTYKRTHRTDKLLRDADELAEIDKESKLVHVLFGTNPDDVSLYDKPMARNAQLWTADHRLLLDGPTATPEQIQAAMKAVRAGGLFGYRFQFPAMRVGRHEVYWHRPLVAYRDGQGHPAVLPDAPLGYLTAYAADSPKLDRAVELWPRMQHRPLPAAVLGPHDAGRGKPTAPNVCGISKLFDFVQKRAGRPLPRSLARQLLVPHRGQTLETWLEALPDDTVRGEVRRLVEPAAGDPPRRQGAAVPDSLTYRRTATRAFEVKYWKTIAALSEGTFLNKNNADCVRDEATQKALPYPERQLEPLGDFLLAYYRRKIAAAGLTGAALAGEVPFRWRTDFDYSWMGGWLKNQDGAAERDLVVVIPGRDRGHAVVMADHYDTAYMADRYDPAAGGTGARMAACGADDNHSATAALMRAAPVFLEMSRKGRLGCDVWLVHLTGEEFPADCLGARALTQRLVEGTLQLHVPGGRPRDLSGVKVRGLYVSDMIAHNNDRDRDVFQISPGADAESYWLAEQAHAAVEVWNASVPVWNARPDRAGRPRGRRSPHGAAVPEIAPFLALSGEVRTPIDPRSTLYNTDGQVFSDAGVPCVLFMENYDIGRSGYHDTHDTMANIDLDYGAAVCAIVIEAVARAAAEG